MIKIGEPHSITAQTCPSFFTVPHYFPETMKYPFLFIRQWLLQADMKHYEVVKIYGCEETRNFSQVFRQTLFENCIC